MESSLRCHETGPGGIPRTHPTEWGIVRHAQPIKQATVVSRSETPARHGVFSGILVLSSCGTLPIHFHELPMKVVERCLAVDRCFSYPL